MNERMQRTAKAMKRNCVFRSSLYSLDINGVNVSAARWTAMMEREKIRAIIVPIMPPAATKIVSKLSKRATASCGFGK
jgi:hypothetical protein